MSVFGITVENIPESFPDPAASGSTHLAIALMPSLAPLRTIRLPKMRTADALATVSRSIARYFPGVRGAQVITVARVRHAEAATGDGEGEQVYAISAVSAAVLETLEQLALARGWQLDRIVPAYAAWALSSQRELLSVTHSDGVVEQFHVHQDIPFDVRRWRPGPEEPLPSARAFVVAHPVETAARYASEATHLEFLTPTITARRQAKRRTAMTAALVAAIVLAIGGAGGAYWQARHALAQFTTQRDQLRPSVTTALRGQSALAMVAEPAQALAKVEEHGVQWTTVIADLANRLPSDAYVEGLRANGDSIAVDGAAESGARAFRTVELSPILKNATPVGSIRRDLPTDTASAHDTPVLEHFTLSARVAHAVPLVPPPARGGPHR